MVDLLFVRCSYCDMWIWSFLLIVYSVGYDVWLFCVKFCEKGEMKMEHCQLTRQRHVMGNGGADGAGRGGGGQYPMGIGGHDVGGPGGDEGGLELRQDTWVCWICAAVLLSVAGWALVITSSAH